jgi:eukaryotic-like serine/threonine-protein kinase
MTAARHEPATAQVLGGRYRLEERIASGGMGTVWAAHDETLDRRVAVKVLNEGLSHDERFVERFRREALAAAGLAHPNIAGVFDYGEEGGRPYIVMELLHGETLAERVRRDGAMDPSLVAGIGSDVAGALADAHQHGLVHRDIKPANIMVTDRGDVKVMDFGIAASATGGTGLTGTGMVMGTARYLSPEQASGGPATPASDLYSLGAVLYELLTGQPAFERPTPVATAMAHVNDPVRPVRELRPDAPPHLAHLIEQCLAKDPAARPASAAAVAAELGADTPLRPSDDTAVLPAVGAGTLELPVAAPTEPGLEAVPAPRRRAWRSPRVLVAAAVALAIVLAVVLSIALGGKGLTLKVPAFRGKTRAQATLLATQLGLHPVFRTQASSRRPGIVVRQRPMAGTEVATGADIVLVVSKGATSSGSASSSPQPSPPSKDRGDHGKPKPPGHDRHRHKKPKPHGH